MTAYVQDLPEPLTATNERVDDIPLLIAHLRHMGIPPLLDAHVPTRGYWSNLGIGWVTTIWLAHLLSQSDNKVRHVQTWVASHPETLRWCIEQEALPTDVHEHRLREVLQMLSDDARWYAFEQALNNHLMHTFGFAYEQVRIHKVESCHWQVLPEGVLQIGHTKTWRPGALRLQIVQATLDPFAMPLTTWASTGRGSVTGRVADAIAQVQAILQPSGLLYVGDEVGALEARAVIQTGGGGYLCPLSDMASIVEDRPSVGRELRPLVFGGDGPQHEPEVDGYEWREPMALVLDGQLVQWDERRLLIRSRVHARTAEESLRGRLTRARSALTSLGERKRGKRRPRTLEALHQAAQDILDSHQVQGLLNLQYEEAVEERVVRRYRGRPTSVRVERDMQVISSINEAALSEAVRQLGWQMYATNLPPETLPLPHLLTMSTAGPPGFERLNGRPLSITPGSLQRDEHVVGLVRLLSLGLRALVLLEIQVYQKLLDEGGAPVLPNVGGRRVAQQAGERLLDAFRDILLTSGRGSHGRASITPLSALQRRVLHLLALKPEIYQYHIEH